MNVEKLLTIEDYQNQFFYCCSKNKEIIFSGGDNVIYEIYKKFELGEMLIKFFNSLNNILKSINKYYEIIEKDIVNTIDNPNELNIYYDLCQLNKELKEIENSIFSFFDIPTHLKNEYIKIYNKYCILKETKKAKKNNFNELKSLIDIKILNNLDAIDNIEEVFNADLEQVSSRIEIYEMLEFRDFSLHYLQELKNNLIGLYLFYIKNSEYTYNFEIELNNNKYPLGNDEILKLSKYIYQSKKINCNTTFISLEKKDPVDDEFSKLNFGNNLIKYYEISDIQDLITLSIIECIDKKINLRICECCHNFFIPSNRSDEKYCNNVFINGMTCKEYAPKNKYRKSINNEELKKVHYNLSQSYRMKINRAKTLKEKNRLIKKFEEYKYKYKEQKEKYKIRELTKEEFIEWIKSQKDLK